MSILEGWTGGIYGMFHRSQKTNFFSFLNHENEQVRYSLKTCSYTGKCLKREKLFKAKPRLHITNHMSWSLSIDDSNHVEDMILISCRIEWWNHKHQLIIQVVHGSRKTFRLRITNNNFLKFMFHGKENQPITHHKNTSVWPWHYIAPRWTWTKTPLSS